MRALALSLALGLAAGAVPAQEVTRHPIPGSDFPISRAVEVPGGADLVWLSGAVPSVADETASPGDPARFGATQTQTVSVLRAIEGTLADLDLAMGDVFRMQVFLVAPADGEGMDFDGFMAGYTRFFGTEDQPNLPVRTVVEVAGLANPDWLVEIEVTAVRQP